MSAAPSKRKPSTPHPAPLEESPDAGRLLPHDLDAERAILGAILLHNDVFDVVARVLTPGDFYRDAHQRLFAAMVRVMARPGGVVDLLTLKDDLQKRSEFDEMGGAGYITALVDGVPRSTNVAHYAAIVKDRSLLRQMIYAGNQIVTSAYTGQEDAFAILRTADRSLVVIEHGHRQGKMRSLSESSAAMMEELQYRMDHRGELRGVETGFPSVNEMTMGWQAGDLNIVAARPSIGKTTFVTNSLVRAAQSTTKTGRPVRAAFFSLEMKRQQLEFRILAELSQVPLTRLQNGIILGDDEGLRVGAAQALMASLDIHIDDAADRSVEDIRSECRRVRAEGGLDLVVVDYIQLMTASNMRKGANRNEELSDISRRLKILADELEACFLVLSQLARTEGEPKVSDLRDSGALEQVADAVVLLHRKDHRAGGTTSAIFGKQRNGSTGTVYLTLDRDTVTFKDGPEVSEHAPGPEGETKEEALQRKQRHAIKGSLRRRQAQSS